MPSTLPVLTGAKKTKRFGTERLVLQKDEELQEQIRREKEARNIEMQAAREAREMAAQIKAQERWQARQEAPAGMPDPIRPMQSAPLPVLRPTQPMPQVAPRPVDTRPTGGQIAMAPIQMAKAVQAPEQVTTPRDALGLTAEDYNTSPEGYGRQFTSEYTNPRFGGIFSRYGKGKETSVDEAAKSRLSDYAQKNVLTKEEGEDFKNLAFSVAKEIEGKIANSTVTDGDIALLNQIDAIRNKARIESGVMTMENPDGSFTVENTAKPMTSALETAGKAFNDAFLRLPMLLGRQAMDEDTRAALDAVLADREQEKSAHPVANMAGTMGANMLMYGGINSLAEGAGLTGQLASRLGGTARAERIARQMVGLGPDLLVDTLPTVVQNAQSDMPVSEQLKEAGKNVLFNMGFNAGAEYAPMLLKALSNNPVASQIAKNADDITDATKQSASSLADTATDVAKNTNEIVDATNAPVNDYAGDLALLEQARDTSRALEAQGIPALQQAERAAEPVPALRQATEQTTDALKAAPEPVEEVAEQIAKGPSQNLNTRYEEFLGNFFKDPTEKDRPIAEALSGFENALKAGDVDGMNAAKEAAKGTVWENDISDIIAGVKYGDDALTSEATRMRRIMPEADYDRYADTIHELHRNEEQLNTALNEAFEGRMDPVDAYEYVQNSQRSYDKIQKYLVRKSKREAELVGVQYEAGAKNAHQKWATKLKQRRDRLKAISNQTESQIEELRHIENALLYDKAQKDVYKEGQKAWGGYTALFDEDSNAAKAAAAEWKKQHPRATRSMALEMEQPTLEATPEEMARIRARNAAGNKNANMDELGRGGEPSFEAMDMAYRQMVKDGELKAGKDLSTEETMNVLERARQIDYDNGDFREAPEFTNGKPYYETQGINEKRYFGEAEIPAGRKERGFAQSMRTEGKIPDEIRRNLTEKPITYKGITNKETAERVSGLWAETSGTFDEAERTLAKLINDNDAGSALYAKNLMTAYSEAGQSENAMKVMEQISEAMTKRGQFNQAAILALAKDDPMTALKYAQRSLDRMNVDGAKKFGDKWVDLKLTPDETLAFTKIEAGDQKAIEELYDQIGKRIGAIYPSTKMEKSLEARRVAMLFNVRTNVRNFGANIPTMGMRYGADRIEGLGQRAYKALVNPDFEVTQAAGPIGAQYRMGATEVFNSDRVQNLLKGTAGKYDQFPDLKNSIMKDRQIYKGTALEKWINNVTGGGIEKINKKLFGKEHVKSGMETLRNATYKLLELGDDPFVKENFIQRMGSYMKASGITNAADVSDEAIQMAWEEAMKATYKDNSWAVKMISRMKQSMQSVPYVGRPVADAVIPFVQAPANIAARMIDYSPIRGTKGIADIIKGTRKNSMETVAKGIEEAAKGLTGTGLIALGFALHNSGIITGSYSDDKDQKEHQKQTGYREYALHVGDKYYNYDWAQPFAEPLIVGTLLADTITKSDDTNDRILQELGEKAPIVNTANGIWSVVKKGTGASLNSWFNASPLQSLSEIMGGNSYTGQETDIAGNIGEVARDFPLSFIPTLFGATARGFDNTQRNAFDKTSPIATFANQAKAKIPGLAETLPASYDTWGNEKTYGRNTAESVASQFVIPGQVGTDISTETDAEINRLFETTGNNSVFPQKAPYKVGDKTLTNYEYSDLQREMGVLSKQFADTLLSTDAYGNMSDVDKAEELGFVYGLSKAIAQKELFNQPIASTYAKAASLYEEAGGGEAGIRDVLAFRELKQNAPSKKEDIVKYLDATGMSTADKERWFGYLSTAKNPYGEAAEEPEVATSEAPAKEVPSLNNTAGRYKNWAEGEPAQQTQASGNIPVLNFDIASSDSYGRFQKVPGINTSTDNYATIYGGMDADSNGRLKKAEIMDYLDASSYSDKQKKALFEAYKTKRMNNPY